MEQAALKGARAPRTSRAAMRSTADYHRDQNGAGAYYRDKLAAIDKPPKSVT
jgi:hypothetical protein